MLAMALCAPGVFTEAGEAAAFVLRSPSLGPGKSFQDAQVLNGYGCTGGNRSPALSWSRPPAGTKSFAITMYDPDERGSGSGWWHWIVYDLPASATGLPENAGAADGKTLPPGAIQGRTDFGASHYDGPCPDPADPPHSYTITVFALSTAKLDLPPYPTPAMIGYSLHAVTLARSRIVVPYAVPSKPRDKTQKLGKD
jgi:Raf kinase inhibitor-like YbhB/YbcL family protein